MVDRKSCGDVTQNNWLIYHIGKPTLSALLLPTSQIICTHYNHLETYPALTSCISGQIINAHSLLDCYREDLPYQNTVVKNKAS